jgi:23S rRNA (cytosine1962-C5)-methyltransferase
VVCQINSRSLFERREFIFEVLKNKLNPLSIYLKKDPHISKIEGLDFENNVIWGTVAETVVIRENGLEFEIDLRSGQKTGFYTDQALNRNAVAAWAKNAKALDLCCYTGGFALHMARAGADVTAVDSSEDAIVRAKRNAERNQLNLNFVEQDIFDWMKEYKGEKFDLVVLDPPRLAPSRASKPRALKTYFRMNEEALKLVKDGGLFISCSCSGQISREEFFSVLASVARRSKRSLQVLFQWGQSPDHPVITACPETMYLKTFACKVGA